MPPHPFRVLPPIEAFGRAARKIARFQHDSDVSREGFTEVFLNPTERLQLAAAVNAVLAGNEGARFAIKWRMWLFYFFVRAQRFIAFSPRLSLVPKTPEATGAMPPLQSVS